MWRVGDDVSPTLSLGTAGVERATVRSPCGSKRVVRSRTFPVDTGDNASPLDKLDRPDDIGQLSVEGSAAQPQRSMTPATGELPPARPLAAPGCLGRRQSRYHHRASLHQVVPGTIACADRAGDPGRHRDHHRPPCPTGGGLPRSRAAPACPSPALQHHGARRLPHRRPSPPRVTSRIDGDDVDSYATAGAQIAEIGRLGASAAPRLT